MRVPRKSKSTPGNQIVDAIRGILVRFEKYGKYLKYPGDWGERAFRGWLVYEIFHQKLRWPIPNIVFGEQFDVLFLNERLMPVVYLETKKPTRDLAGEADFLGRVPCFPTILYAVLTDGYDWLRFDVTTKQRKQISLSSRQSEWEEFLRPLQALRHLYVVRV